MRNSGYDRAALDFYREPSWVVDALLDREDFAGGVYDPACGSGTIPKACLARGIPALGSDIADRGYGAPDMDFFEFTEKTSRAIVSNPPYAVLREFIDHALSITTGKVAVIARLAFLESQTRKAWWESSPLAHVWICSRRPSMPPGASDAPAKGGTIAYGWFVFHAGHFGAPTIGWIA